MYLQISKFIAQALYDTGYVNINKVMKICFFLIFSWSIWWWPIIVKAFWKEETNSITENSNLVF